MMVLKRTRIGDQWYSFNLGKGITAGVRYLGGGSWGYYFRLKRGGKVVAQLGENEYRAPSYAAAVNRIREFAEKPHRSTLQGNAAL